MEKVKIRSFSEEPSYGEHSAIMIISNDKRDYTVTYIENLRQHTFMYPEPKCKCGSCKTKWSDVVSEYQSEYCGWVYSEELLNCLE